MQKAWVKNTFMFLNSINLEVMKTTNYQLNFFILLYTSSEHRRDLSLSSYPDAFNNYKNTTNIGKIQKLSVIPLKPNSF